MATVITMQKQLRTRSKPIVLPGIDLRTFVDARDIPVWLDLHARSLPHSAGGRLWTELDFAREFLRQPWWCAARMWFAQSTDGNARTLGTVTLRERDALERTGPSIHWLLVDPDYWRRGIGRMLVSAAEETCWQTGRKSLSVETLSSWKEAVAFYKALGYEST